MPRKGRKRKRGIETAAHNCVEIDALFTHITGFRLDHRWNRTTMGDNAVTGLVTITVLIQIIVMAYVNFYYISGKTGDLVLPTKPWSASCGLKPKE